MNIFQLKDLDSLVVNNNPTRLAMMILDLQAENKRLRDALESIWTDFELGNPLDVTVESLAKIAQKALEEGER